MTKDKAVEIMTRLLKEEMPLMTQSKCFRTAKKVVGLLLEYKVLTLTEESQSGGTQNSQLPKKS